ncbi:MAG TPA: hypothetical protein VGI70_04745, partial [Polyangiales bacterium]
FQNNHHRYAQSAKFAQRDFEWDPAYGFIRALSLLGIADTEQKAGAPIDDIEIAPLPTPAQARVAIESSPAV